MDILTFLGLNYRDASLIILYFVVLGISIPINISIEWLYHIKNNFENKRLWSSQLIFAYYLDKLAKFVGRLCPPRWRYKKINSQSCRVS